MALARMKRRFAPGLYLHFPAEVLHKNVVQAATELHGLLADQLEALIEPGKDLV
jgi:hypothetical protein